MGPYGSLRQSAPAEHLLPFWRVAVPCQRCQLGHRSSPKSTRQGSSADSSQGTIGTLSGPPLTRGKAHLRIGYSGVGNVNNGECAYQTGRTTIVYTPGIGKTQAAPASAHASHFSRMKELLTTPTAVLHGTLQRRFRTIASARNWGGSISIQVMCSAP